MSGDEAEDTRQLQALGSRLQQFRESRPPLPDPPFQRPAGMDDAQWRAAIAAARSAHDESARRMHEAAVIIGAELFGGSGTDRLPALPPDASPEVHWRQHSLAVDAGRSLRELSPELDLPEGPRPPLPELAEARIPLGLYEAERDRPGPAIITLHGGAFWMGGGGLSHELDGPLSRWLARSLHGTVIDVDYRLAPEHPYPASIVDFLTVLDWVHRSAEELGVDRDRIVVLGVSSGGNTAALGALIDAHRPDRAPLLAAQVLVVPALNLAARAALHSATPEAGDARTRQLHSYLGTDIDPSSPFVSPACGAPAEGLPSAVVLTGLHDEIAVGGAEWAERLAEAGVAVRHREFPMTHTVSTPAVWSRLVGELHHHLTELLGDGPSSEDAGSAAPSVRED